MAVASDLVAQARARWAAAPMLHRVGVLAGVATLAAVALLVYARSNDTAMTVLFSGLEESDAAEIVERLRSQHVPYEIGEDGTTILVPEQNVHETRLSLAAEGLPVGGGIGFEIFDTQRFGESEFVEQVQYLRALEGELGRTISALQGVDSARVHLVLPERTLIGGADQHARASIAVAMQGARHLRDDQVRGIVHLVAGSVRDLDPANVTIVDGDGRRLSGGDGEDGTESADDAESLRERIERGRQRAVQELLDQTIGPGAAVVRLSADVSFTHEERIEESYDPDRTATRSFELTTEGGSAETDGTGGIAGAVSALPGGPGAEPTVGAVGEGGRRTEVRNFEVTKMVTREVEPLGRVTRLSIAVVVDGHWEGEGDARHFVPRTDEELARIRSVVTSAAGLREDRGDTLTVECVPFVAVAAGEAEIAATPAAAVPSTTLWGVGLGVVVLVVVASMVLARRRRARAEAEKTALALAEPVTQAPSTTGALSTTTDAATPNDDDPEAIRVRVIDFARKDPELAARVVRAWLASEAAQPAPLPASATVDAA